MVIMWPPNASVVCMVKHTVQTACNIGNCIEDCYISKYHAHCLQEVQCQSVWCNNIVTVTCIFKLTIVLGIISKYTSKFDHLLKEINFWHMLKTFSPAKGLNHLTIKLHSPKNATPRISTQNIYNMMQSLVNDDKNAGVKEKITQKSLEKSINLCAKCIAVKC